MTSSTRVGFIGLGIMGAPMAQHLLEAGYTLAVHTRSRAPLLFQEQARVCATGAQVAASADVIFIMVPDTEDVERVLFDAQGVASGLTPGQLVVDCSSIDPMSTREFARRIRELGCGYVDAPVSGGEVGAKAASLTMMCGGSEADFERAKPLLMLMSKTITRVGEAGAGQVAKVANQMIVAQNIAAVAEAFVFARKAGVDPARVREALMGGFAGSRILELHGERMITRRFEPGFRIALHKKDVRLALESARALGVALPQTAGVAQLINTCMALGLDQSDHAALVQAVEHAAGLD